MDNLVLIRVADVLEASLRDSVVAYVRQEAAQRFRFAFAGASDRPVTIVVSLRPELPWIGRPAVRSEGPAWSPGPFAVRANKELSGLRVVEIEKQGADRVVAFRFSGGRALVVELATHGANLVLLDPEGRVEDAAHHPRGARERLRVGFPYAPPPLPAGKLVPFGAGAAALDAFVEARVREGEERFEALRRDVFGVGSAGAALVLAEAAASGRSAGAVLAARLDDLSAGRVEPVVEAPGDPLEAAERGPLDPGAFRLWPWPPPATAPGCSLLASADAAGTAGLFHEALERGAWIGARVDALRAVLRQELRRVESASRRAAEDVEAFEDPDAWRRRGEALLAGLTLARRSGDHVVVPDPYDPSGREISVPAPAGVPLAKAAEECFRRHRRARRGLDAARERARTLQARRGRLEALADAWHDPRPDGGAAERELAEALRREGIAVGLAAGTRAQREARRAVLPRLEGVRLFTSRDGLTILVGRTGRDNDRLTFKLAGPDDFWFHAHGVPGAHVVVRNPDRAGRPPAATVEDAARAAAWYSEARGHGAVDVAWTRRKNVRRARGGAPGLVLLKRFETIRVEPAIPPGARGES